ncbi:MAG: sugar phosphate nucleotidyltransferase [Mucinivorans sp.]
MDNFDQYIIQQSASILEAMAKIDKQSGSMILTLFVLDDRGVVLGTITDGDCRRAILRGIQLTDTVAKVYNAHFTSLTNDTFDLAKQRMIRAKRYKIVPVLDSEGRMVKLLDFQHKKAYLPIDAVLMAGGRGERLRPATLTTPKPLLEVAGKPIIDYNVDNMLNHGIEHISVTTNYLAEQLDAHFASPIEGIQVQTVREPKFLGTMGAIKFVENWHNDTILIMNSDLFTNIDLEDFFLHFKEHDADMSIAAVPYSVNIPYGIFEIEGTRNIVGVHEKPAYHYYANAGIYLIKRELLNLIPDDTFFNATDLMALLIEQKRSVIRFPLSGYWIDIGKPEDFKKVQELAKHTRK